jgi:enamine deaminase RidA (YjgF/YER057c/UK114 family)
LLFLQGNSVRPASTIKDTPSINGYAFGNTLYLAGQQGADSKEKLTGRDITRRTQNAFSRQEKPLKKLACV